ncbi:MAG: hypothetical protein E6Q97_17935 [Desulfurellales bacterium]|nr:MAG: hypothetical protein E6Q97_17935 [Desulfurellales bacterium]
MARKMKSNEVTTEVAVVETAAVETTVAKPAPVKVESIGSFVRRAVSENPTSSSKEILAKVKAQYPEAKTTEGCIGWYKTDMRKKGLLVGGRVGSKTPEGIKAKITELQAQIESLKDQLFVLEGDKAVAELEAA